MVTTTKNAVKECVVIVLYQLRNGGPLGLIEACSNSATMDYGSADCNSLFWNLLTSTLHGDAAITRIVLESSYILIFYEVTTTSINRYILLA